MGGAVAILQGGAWHYVGRFVDKVGRKRDPVCRKRLRARDVLAPAVLRAPGQASGAARRTPRQSQKMGRRQPASDSSPPGRAKPCDANASRPAFGGPNKQWNTNRALQNCDFPKLRLCNCGLSHHCKAKV
ncbi:hypothetical protein GCM10022213_14510 [Parerythrobacter jejuensis]